MSEISVEHADSLNNERERKIRLDYLDGMRALAALWVVTGQIWMHRNQMEAHHGLLGLLTNWTLYNHLAVDIFIVLSGFCLMLPVMKNGSIPGGAIHFYKRRMRRILPPLYFSMILTVLYMMVGQWRQHGAIGFNKLVLIFNVALLQDIFPQFNVINGAYWSVALEYKIYFLFPLFVALYFRYGAVITLVFSGIVGYGLTALLTAWQPHQAISWAQTAPWYILLFGMGMCACAFACRPSNDSQKRLVFPALVATFLGSSILLYFNSILATGSHARYLPCLRYIDPFAGAFVALALTLLHHNYSPRHRLIRVLSWPPLAKLGVFSYSMYLIHVPVMTLIGHMLDLSHAIASHYIVEELILFIVGLPIIIGVSYVFFLICERPFMTKKSSKL